MKAELLQKVAASPHLLDSITSREFEELVASILESFGWQVSVTQPTRDGGYDILAIQTGAPGLEASWIVECKKYGQNRRVGIEIVRAVYGVRDYLSFANAAVVTTASFTRDALEFAINKTAIKLIDRAQLLSWISKAAAAPQFAAPPPRFQSVFISYSTKDDVFVQRLYADLQAKGVRCWFAPEDLKIGSKFRVDIDRAIQLQDKLLLVLSEHSVQSDWVEKEIETAFERERKENRLVLFPITLDDSVMGAQAGWAADIRRTRHIGDFRQWNDHDAYAKAFERLLRDLESQK